MKAQRIRGHRLPKEEVIKYTKLFFVWLTIILLAITAFLLLYYYDNLLRTDFNPEFATSHNATIELKDPQALNSVVAIREWEFYPDCNSYEEYLNREDSTIIDVTQNNEAILVKGRRTTCAYVLRLKNMSGLDHLALTILIPAINSANWIYVDGQYVQGIGDIGKNYTEYSANQRLKVNVQNSTEIVILAENRGDTIGGMFRPAVMGKNIVVMGLVNNHTVTTLLVMLYAIIVAVIGIWVFATSKDKVYLWFSLVCLSFCVTISEGMFRGVGTTLITAKEIIFSLAYITMGLYLVLFCSSLISRSRNAKIAQFIAVGFNVLAVLLVILVLPFTHSADKFIFSYINVISFSNMLYLWVHAMISYFRTGKKFLMFTTVSVVLFAMIFQGVVARQYISMYTFSPRNWGFAFIVIAISCNVFRQLYLISKRSLQFNENITSEVVKRTQKIEALLQERKEFTSMVAHDLKSPLASVKMMLSEVDAPKLSIDKMDKLINAIDLKIMSMTDNLTTLQNFNAIDMKNEDYQVVEVGEFLEKVYEFIVPDSDAEGIALSYKPLKRDLYINVPTKKLTRALENIIYNAISFCKEDDRIELKYRQIDKFIEISVLDTGCGIAPQSLPHIFDKFYSDRKNDSQATFKGDGLGLYFVKLLVAELGGSVDAKSWVNEGTEIILNIPLYDGPIEKKENKKE